MREGGLREVSEDWDWSGRGWACWSLAPSVSSQGWGQQGKVRGAIAGCSQMRQPLRGAWETGLTRKRTHLPALKLSHQLFSCMQSMMGRQWFEAIAWEASVSGGKVHAGQVRKWGSGNAGGEERFPVAESTKVAQVTTQLQSCKSLWDRGYILHGLNPPFATSWG